MYGRAPATWQAFTLHAARDAYLSFFFVSNHEDRVSERSERSQQPRTGWNLYGLQVRRHFLHRVHLRPNPEKSAAWVQRSGSYWLLSLSILVTVGYNWSVQLLFKHLSCGQRVHKRSNNQSVISADTFFWLMESETETTMRKLVLCSGYTGKTLNNRAQFSILALHKFSLY